MDYSTLAQNVQVEVLWIQPHFRVPEAGPSVLTTARLRNLCFSFPVRM